MICQQSVAKFESKIYQIGRFNSRRFPEKLNIEAKVDSKMSLKFNFIIKIQDWTLQQLARYLVTYLSTNHLKYLSPEWSLKSDNFSTISTVILFRAVAIIIMVMIGLLQKEKRNNSCGEWNAFFSQDDKTGGGRGLLLAKLPLKL